MCSPARLLSYAPLLGAFFAISAAACGSVEAGGQPSPNAIPPAIPDFNAGAQDASGDDAPPLGDPAAQQLRVAALVAAESGDFPAALAKLDAAEELVGVVYVLRVDRAIVLGMSGDAQASLREAERAVKLRPGVIFPPAATVAQIEALLWLGDRSGALRLAEGFVAAHPKNAGAHYALGKALLDFVRSAEAVDAFRDALRLAPGDYAATLGLVGALASSGRSDEAAQALASLATDHPADPWIAYQQGIIWQARGDVAQAMVSFKAAIDAFAPRPFADASFLIARILLERDDAGDRAAVRPYLEYFVEHAPPHAAPERRYAMEQLEKMSK